MELIGDLLGAESEFQAATEGPFSFNSRNGYLRIDASAGDVIHSITFDNDAGDGFAIDHLAFMPVPSTVPVPGSLWMLGSALVALRIARRRA